MCTHTNAMDYSIFVSDRMQKCNIIMLIKKTMGYARLQRKKQADNYRFKLAILS